MKIKKAKQDFTFADLPRNRKEVFFDVIKQQWRKLFLIGLFLLIGFMPIIAVLFFRDNYLLQCAVKVTEGAMTESEYSSMAKIAHIISSVGCAVGLFFLSIPLSSVLRLLRQLIWSEPIFLKEDIIQGIKDNYKGLAISSLIFGVVLVLSKLMLFATDKALVQGIPIGIFVAFIMPPMLFSVLQGTMYQGKYSKFFSNSILFYIKEAPKTILFGFILLCPLLLNIMHSYLILKYILVIAIVFMILPFTLMMFFLFACSVFDKYINLQQYPEIYKKGIYVEEERKEE